MHLRGGPFWNSISIMQTCQATHIPSRPQEAEAEASVYRDWRSQARPILTINFLSRAGSGVFEPPAKTNSEEA